MEEGRGKIAKEYGRVRSACQSYLRYFRGPDSILSSRTRLPAVLSNFPSMAPHPNVSGSGSGQALRGTLRVLSPLLRRIQIAKRDKVK